MLEYNIQINNGVEAFGTEGKTITVNEVIKTVDVKALAHHVHMHNQLIPEQVAKDVLENFSVACAELMSMGFAIQFCQNNDVMMRIYPDIKLKCGNINLTKAKELMENPNLTEAEMVENAGDLVSKAGVVVRAYAECEKKFTDLLMSESSGIQRKDVIEKAYINKKDSTSEPNNGDTQNNSNNNNEPPSGGNVGD